MPQLTKTAQTREIAKATRATNRTPDCWMHHGNLHYSLSGSSVWYCGMTSRLHRAIGTCYAYDIHEAAAINQTGIRSLPV